MELSFADLLTVARPMGWQAAVDRPGHKLVRAGWQTSTRSCAASGWPAPHQLRRQDTASPQLQGCLAFDGLDRTNALLAELPDSYASKRDAVERGLDFVFSFANPLPVMPQGAVVDYEPVVLATLPPAGAGAGLAGVMRERGRYVRPGALLAALQAEGPEQRAARWAHTPPAVLQRQPPWLV